MDAADSLAAVLERERAVVDELVQLAEQKQAKIADVDAVSELTRREQRLVRILEAAERERMELCDVLAPGQTLQQLAEHPAVGGGRFREIAAALQSQFSRLRVLNEANRAMVSESLAVAQFSVSLLTEQQVGTYARKGTNVHNKTLFDQKV